MRMLQRARLLSNYVSNGQPHMHNPAACPLEVGGGYVDIYWLSAAMFFAKFHAMMRDVLEKIVGCPRNACGTLGQNKKGPAGHLRDARVMIVTTS